MNRFRITGFSFILLSVMVVLIGSCTTTKIEPDPIPARVDPRMFDYYTRYWVKVNSFATSDAASKGKKVFIISGMQTVSDNDLEFLEVARYIENALSQKGYSRVDSIEKADILIRLGYGIGTPQTTSETIVTSHGYSYAAGWMWFTVPPKTQMVHTTTYTSNLILEAYDLKDSKRKNQLWKTTAITEGESDDLPRVLAYMIAASSKYFGTTTGKQEKEYTGGFDTRVLEIWK